MLLFDLIRAILSMFYELFSERKWCTIIIADDREKKTIFCEEFKLHLLVNCARTLMELFHHFYKLILHASTFI